MTSGKKLTRIQNRRLIDSLLFATSELIDKALLAHGKSGLYEQDANRITPIDRLFAPLRQQYENWVASGQIVEDYDRDPNVSDNDKKLVLMWRIPKIYPLTRAQAQQAQDTITIWGYRRYGHWIIDALFRYAHEQGLSDEDIWATLPPDERKRVDEIEKIIGNFWANPQKGKNNP
jgi:hypothetical protein